MRVLQFLPVMLVVVVVVVVVCELWAGGPALGQEPPPPTFPNSHALVSTQPSYEDHTSGTEVTVEQASLPEDCPPDFTGEISTSDESQWAYPEPGDLSQLVISRTALSPRPFVHERQTVRTSERMAEIWVTLPEGYQSSVSVNHVEYPPEGEFRIFRTKLNSNQPHRFYLSAKSWDPVANSWVKLGLAHSIPPGAIEEFDVVTLMPRQRVEVHFHDPTSSPKKSAVHLSDLKTLLEEQIGPLKTEVEKTNTQLGEQGRQIGEQGRQIGEQGRQLGEQGQQIGEQGRQLGEQGRQIGEQGRQIGEQGRQLGEQGRQLGEQGRQLGEQGRQIGEQGRQIGVQNMQLKKLSEQSDQIQKHELQTQSRVTKLEIDAAPHAQSSKVTGKFQFDETALQIIGKCHAVNDAIQSVIWTQHPASVVIAFPKRVTPMPPRPFSAPVTFLIRQGQDAPFSQTTIQVEFSDQGEHIVAAIPFQKSLAGLLETALVDGKKAPGTFHVKAIIDYEVTLGDLGSVHVAGPLGNEIELTILP